MIGVTMYAYFNIPSYIYNYPLIVALTCLMGQYLMCKFLWSVRDTRGCVSVQQFIVKFKDLARCKLRDTV